MKVLSIEDQGLFFTIYIFFSFQLGNDVSTKTEPILVDTACQTDDMEVTCIDRGSEQFHGQFPRSWLQFQRYKH